MGASNFDHAKRHWMTEAGDLPRHGSKIDRPPPEACPRQRAARLLSAHVAPLRRKGEQPLPGGERDPTVIGRRWVIQESATKIPIPNTCTSARVRIGTVGSMISARLLITVRAGRDTRRRHWPPR